MFLSKFISIILYIKMIFGISANYYVQHLYMHLKKDTPKSSKYLLNKKELISMLRYLIVFINIYFNYLEIQNNIWKFFKLFETALMKASYKGIQITQNSICACIWKWLYWSSQITSFAKGLSSAKDMFRTQIKAWLLKILKQLKRRFCIFWVFYHIR